MCNELRPTRLKDIIGQASLVSRLRINIASARNRLAPLSHVLLDGPPGLGKTTLAGCIANELRLPIYITIASLLNSVAAATEFILKAKKASVFFIDEIHCLPIEVEEYLYPVLEDNRLDIHLENSPIGQIDLPPLTFIGATTRSGDLSMPFRDRFQIREHLDYYSVKELAKIVKVNSMTVGLLLKEGVDTYLGQMSRGTPRIANNRLLWVRDYAWKHHKLTIEMDFAKEAMRKIGVDDKGLDDRDRKVMLTMRDQFDNRPVGVKSLASSVGLAESTVADEIEPWALHCGVICRTGRGRQLTQLGLDYLKNYESTH